MRHDRGDLLSDLWDALTSAWGAVTSGGAYVRDQETFGILGWVRTVEVTHGAAGWHVHVHAVVCLDGPTSPEMMDELGGRMFARWERKLSKLGFSAVQDRGGLDVRPVRMTGDSIEQVAGYISKITHEITSPSTKEGRSGNRAPFAILRDALETGNADDVELWWAWEKVSAGRKQLTWSKALRSWAGREKSDDEIASEDRGGESVLVLPHATWTAVRQEVADLLDAVELGGVPAGQRWLRSRGLAFLTPQPRPPSDER
jgi:hypothetical protein